jgi:hypothetical protein
MHSYGRRKEHKNNNNTYVEILMSCKDESSWGGIPFVNKISPNCVNCHPDKIRRLKWIQINGNRLQCQ